MLKSIDYATLLQYSPKGTSYVSKNSQAVKEEIKAGRIEDKFMREIFQMISENEKHLSPFLNRDATLVPVPRSSKIQDGDLWPALEIVKMLSSFSLGIPTPCLIRSHAIRKSSLCKPEDRPTVDEHYNSLFVKESVRTTKITLVDDVLTNGNTSFACAIRFAEKFPNVTIKVFAMIKTNLFVPEIDVIKCISVGTLTYDSLTGKCNRMN